MKTLRSFTSIFLTLTPALTLCGACPSEGFADWKRAQLLSRLLTLSRSFSLSLPLSLSLCISFSSFLLVFLSLFLYLYCNDRRKVLPSAVFVHRLSLWLRNRRGFSDCGSDSTCDSDYDSCSNYSFSSSPNCFSGCASCCGLIKRFI